MRARASLTLTDTHPARDTAAHARDWPHARIASSFIGHEVDGYDQKKGDRRIKDYTYALGHTMRDVSRARARHTRAILPPRPAS